MAAKGPKEVARIHDATVVKFFVLYVLQSLGGHATKDAMDEVVFHTENVSYFDYSEALDALMSTEHITIATLPEGTYYVLTTLGQDALVHFTRRIPSWARGRVAKAVLDYRARLKYDSEIRYKVERLEDGAAMVTLSIHDRDKMMFSTSLRMPTSEDAGKLGEAFKKNPAPMYGTVVQALSQLMDEINRAEESF